MRRVGVLMAILLALVAATALASCSSSLADKVVGNWGADFLASLEDQPLTQEQRLQVQQMSQNVSLGLLFGEDGTMTVSTAGLGNGERSESAIWEVVSTEGNSITIRTRQTTEGDGQQVQDLVLLFDSGDRFATEIGGRRTVFNRL
ncbi:MAG: hypothetical protein JW797_07620 [Bradymonadales bacterium]|nr:hypothetical protein [Bradymonadales bacterium]